MRGVTSQYPTRMEKQSKGTVLASRQRRLLAGSLSRPYKRLQRAGLDCSLSTPSEAMQFNIFALFAATSLFATHMALASPAPQAAAVELEARSNYCLRVQVYVPIVFNGCPKGIAEYICGSSAGEVYCCNNPDCLNDDTV
ncbi:hypothetical protein HMN09_01109600 [Mycena chlorophos]|uniref:Uncharacterized protein n=1 Tax=Mycena chlorophos TaxID=658473 RepID=A0A8H6W1Z5_MYCCL|nr:hypothetical protein HMN09_01109600 [Mycena chlorophos]